MLVEIGLFLIILGILFDDLTTIFLLIRGYGVLETNPLYNMFGVVGYIFSMIIIYSLIIWFWLYVNRTYNRMYSRLYRGYKIYDLFVYMMCVFIILMTIIKLTLGFNNIGHIIDYSRNKDKIHLELERLNEIRNNDVEMYSSNNIRHYFNSFNNINIGTFWFCVIFGYILFRIGYRVSPYEY